MSSCRRDNNRQLEVCLETLPGVYCLAEVFESCLLSIILFSGEKFCVRIDSFICCVFLHLFSINIVNHYSLIIVILKYFD